MTTSASQTDRTKHSRIPQRRIAVFVAIVLVILLAANCLVCATWSHFLKPCAAEWQTIWLTLAFVSVTILGARYSGLWLRIVYRVAALWLGVLNFAFFAACATWIVAAMALLFHLQINSEQTALALFGAAIIASIYSFLNALFVRVTRVTVKLPHRLPEAWHGRTAAFVSDFHLGNFRGAGFSKQIVAKLERLQPHVVFVSGDLFDGTKADFDELIAPWKGFSPPAGTLFVTGNHEEFRDRSPFLKALQRAGIRVLNNEKIEVDGLQIIGVHDEEATTPAVLREILRRAQLDRNRPSILLAHQPSAAAIAAENNISLQLSGHTHGGQCWPWTFIARRVHGPLNHGLHRLGNTLIYTGYGVGTWGPPMRLGTKPEITLLSFET